MVIDAYGQQAMLMLYQPQSAQQQAGEQALQLPMSQTQRFRKVASRACIFAICVAVLAVSGCAPGMSGPALGTRPRAAEPAESSPPKPEVVVVEKSNPQERLASQVRSQESEIAELRDALGANRARADAAEAAARDAQTQMRNLQTQLADVSTRVDTAAAQSEKAFQISTEFLSNLVAAREEQRSLIERNLRTFDAMDQRLKNIEGLVAETRQQRQSEAAAAQANLSQTDQRMQKAERELTQLRQQLVTVNRQNEEVRAAIDSGAMMSMLRDLEATRRDTSMLRGAVEELQREQEAARKRMQDYYLDLDARIQALQDKQAAAASKPGGNDIGSGGESFAAPAATSSEHPEAGSSNAAHGLEAASPSSVGVQQPSTDSAPLPPLEIVPYEAGVETSKGGINAAPEKSTASERSDVTVQQVGAARAASDVNDAETGAPKGAQPSPVTAHGVITTDWGANAPSPVPAEPSQ